MAEKIIKSVSSTNHSYITFVNNHSDEASVLWYNFEGELVKHASIKEGGTYGVKTFVGHPWTAKDTQTGETLLTGGGKVFYPQSNPTVSEKIYITTPEDSQEGQGHGLQFMNRASCPPWIRRKISK